MSCAKGGLAIGDAVYYKNYGSYWAGIVVGFSRFRVLVRKDSYSSYCEPVRKGRVVRRET